MADVFVSYARPDELLAERVAESLRADGYTVWRDDELPAHRPYAQVIEERLKDAKAVVVLWSARSATSQWVRAEADAARSLGTLIQATLDQTTPPMPFNQVQCADLSKWKGETESAGWRKVLASVTELAGSSVRPDDFAAGPSQGERSVCVLPFANMSGDAEQEYFSDGISEDITTDLSKISALTVIARNTAFTFKGQAVDVCEIARKLGVSHVLEGSVRKAAGRVRITAQLIDGKSGSHVWAERYDRDLTDIFAIQDEISKAIVAALRLKLLPEERTAIEQRGTLNVDAYNLYLMARKYWITGDFGDRRREDRVIRLTKRALEIDPDYPQALALMGLAQANLFYAYSGNEGMDDGLVAAERALSLDPSIAEAHLPRAWHLALRGQHDEADAEIETALRLNPDCWEANKEAARIFYRRGKLDEAIGLLRKATELADSDFHSLGMLTAAYLARGDHQLVRASAEKMVPLIEQVLVRDPDNGAALAFVALSYAALGQLDRAREYVDRAMLLDPDNLYMRYNLAWPLIAFFQDKEAALDLLEPAFAKAGRNLISLALADRNLDPLRDDPRFQQMLAAASDRVGLPSSING
ncbi:TIR domain-containing protein [Sphingomonas sp. RB56-2]|uniref:TIR domain-containing protein n=1 Tax=Sphingomonas brevis TaxID=2908206 RepID=A0ABT0S702_9SPHN|nr:TIR domain-containing protein [Sphingomonas brevis]MCL6740175.1 TIR domain-containing protein [Sphingomonas brevis]